MPTINKKQIQVIPSAKRERNRERHKLYNSARWRQTRQIYLMEHPLCEKCLEEGVVNGEHLHVHHILSPFDPNISENEKWKRLLDYSNLKTLCEDCHGALHAEQQRHHIE